MLKGYTTKEIVEQYMLQSINETYTGQLERTIEGVERVIEKETNRVFIADTEASARVFDGDGTPELLIDECVAIDKVEVGKDSYGDTFEEIGSTGANKYFTEPANAIVKGMPIFKLVLNQAVFTEGRQNNRVTAKWGYSEEVPADIQFAATVFVAGILNQQRGAGGDTVKSERIGDYTVTFNNDMGDSYADFIRAKEILQSNTRHLL